MYEIFELLCEKYGITPYKFCKDTGIRTSTISSWKKKNSLAGSKLSTAICEYFGVSMDYLMTGKEIPEKREITLTAKDERDIAKTLDKLVCEMENQENSPLYYNGVEVDDESRELMKEALDNALRQLKMINKVKYNPNKNKK